MSALEVVPRPLSGAAAQPARITRPAVEAMLEQGYRVPEIAAALEVRGDSVRRKMREWKLIEPMPTLQHEQRELAKRLTEDGVPYTWIAETIGLSHIEPNRGWLVEAVAARAASGHESDDWLSVWPTILHNSELLKLHREIAPKRSKHSA